MTIAGTEKEIRGTILSEYDYHGYTIAKIRVDLYGIVYAAYKDEKMIVWDTRKKVVEETVDWHALNNCGMGV